MKKTAYFFSILQVFKFEYVPFLFFLQNCAVIVCRVNFSISHHETERNSSITQMQIQPQIIRSVKVFWILDCDFWVLGFETSLSVKSTENIREN